MRLNTTDKNKEQVDFVHKPNQHLIIESRYNLDYSFYEWIIASTNKIILPLMNSLVCQRRERLTWFDCNTSYYTLSNLINSQRVIIVHLRRANPTRHLSTSSQGEIKLRPESLGRALPLQGFSLIVNAESAAESRELYFSYKINTFPSVLFFSKLTLNSTTVQLPFTTDFKKKSFSFKHIFYH